MMMDMEATTIGMAPAARPKITVVNGWCTKGKPNKQRESQGAANTSVFLSAMMMNQEATTIGMAPAAMPEITVVSGCFTKGKSK